MRAKLILIFIACLLIACTHQKASEIAPNEIMGMQKMWETKGEKALESVMKSHIGDIRFVEDVAIAGYGMKGKSITLWITTYPNASVAEIETERMANAMMNFEDWNMLKKEKVNGYEVYSTLRDVRHYFWSNEYCMFYIIPRNLNESEIKIIIESLKCGGSFPWQ